MNRKPEAIQAYKTSDGQIFEGEREAQLHQAQLDLNVWYSNNKLYSDGTYVDFDELHAWLRANSEHVAALLSLKA